MVAHVIVLRVFGSFFHLLLLGSEQLLLRSGGHSK